MTLNKSPINLPRDFRLCYHNCYCCSHCPSTINFYCHFFYDEPYLFFSFFLCNFFSIFTLFSLIHNYFDWFYSLINNWWNWGGLKDELHKLSCKISLKIKCKKILATRTQKIKLRVNKKKNNKNFATWAVWVRGKLLV